METVRSGSSESSTTNSSSSSTVNSDNKPNGNPTVSSENSETGSSLASLALFVENNVKPYYKDYNHFATSYISSTIPSQDRIICDETGSFTAEAPPFKTLVKDREFTLQEKRRQEIGESKRKGKIVPASRLIIKEIENCKKTIKNTDDRRSYFFFKAREWCEVTKALAIDAKYPKTSVGAIRDKYSEEHRKALKLSRKAKGLRDNTRIFESKARVSPFPIPLELLDTEIGTELSGHLTMAKVVEEETREQVQVREALSRLFEDIKPIPKLPPGTDQPWQLKALKTGSLKPKPVKKAPWKRTEYPPKSKDEKIADLRKLLPKPKAEDLQTDYLSGIWEPEMMTDSFSISGFNYDSRLVPDTSKVDWWTVHDAKEKCKNWLRLATSD